MVGGGGGVWCVGGLWVCVYGGAFSFTIRVIVHVN